MTSRIHRGFHRIGVVLAMLLATVAVWSASLGFWRQVSARDPWDNRFEVAPVHIFTAEYRMALFLAGVAIALYAAARAVGWVLAGFMGPSTRP